MRLKTENPNSIIKEASYKENPNSLKRGTKLYYNGGFRNEEI